MSAELWHYILCVHPGIAEHRAELIDDTSVQVDGKTLACQEFDYSGGEYKPGTRFWIDAEDVVLRYCWQQDRSTRWDIYLRNYQPAA